MLARHLGIRSDYSLTRKDVSFVDILILVSFVDHPKRTSFLFLLRSRFSEGKICYDDLICRNWCSRGRSLFAQCFVGRCRDIGFLMRGSKHYNFYCISRSFLNQNYFMVFCQTWDKKSVLYIIFPIKQKRPQVMQDRKKQRITLKQYIHSNSLRKQALSRANSRQSSLCAPSSPARHTLNFHQKQASTKEGLLKQIKIKLAEFIDQDQTLVDVLKMIDRVIELYNQEIKQNRQQIQVLNSVIKQHQIQVAPKHLNRSDNQSRILIEGNSQEVPSQFSMSFHPTRTQHQLLTATNNSNKQRWLQDSHNTSEQKDEIPNIRLLLQTRNKQTQQVSEKLKETLENKNILYPEPNESVIESFGLDKTNSQRRRRSSGTSNCSNHLDPAKFFNHEQEPSQIRFSVRSSLWNNHFEGLSMRKTCQPDKSEL